jgi:2-polyprenyl-3-methyl-5-hydroxy-6-metoxy-1,4-benzoquinol methylase
MNTISFSEAEKQLLATVRLIEIRPQDWETGETIVATRQQLLEQGSLFLDEELIDWSQAFDSLLRKNLLQIEGRRYVLTRDGRISAARFYREVAGRRFGLVLTLCERSAAYSSFCEAVLGQDLCQYSVLDVEQLDRLIQVLDLTPEDHVLDLGCGIGKISEYISDRTGARLTGIDLAGPAIRRANDRTVTKRQRVDFVEADIGTLELDTRFHAIVGIDTLYFLDDLPGTVGKLADLLVPRARMGILCSELLRGGDKDYDLQPSETRMGQALAANGLQYRALDYTQNEEEIWRRRGRLLEELRTAFETEGNLALYGLLRRETERSMRWVEAGRVRRFLYHVRTD